MLIFYKELPRDVCYHNLFKVYINNMIVTVKVVKESHGGGRYGLGINVCG